MSFSNKYEERYYRLWQQMVSRCTKTTHQSYKRYGGRGIRVEWNSYREFRNDMGYRPDGMTVERIDNDGPYTKWNCRWATRKEQMHNKRNNVLIKYRNSIRCMAAWAEYVGVKKGRFRKYYLDHGIKHAMNINNYSMKVRI